MSALPLRLFAPDGTNGSRHRTQELRLSDFYRQNFRPLWKAADRSPGTLEKLDTALKYWSQLTEDPPLSAISELHTAEFCQALAKLRGLLPGSLLARNTIRAHCVAVQQVLDAAGPPSRKRPHAAGILNRVPFVPKPPQEIHEVDDAWSLEEVEALLAACTRAKAPRLPHVSPPDWWSALILTAYHTGARLDSLRKFRTSHITVDEFGTWINIPNSAAKRRAGYRAFVNRHALDAINQARPPAEGIVFPWPLSPGKLFVWMGRILSASTIPPARHFRFHALRKAFATELAKINGLIVPAALGHAPGRSVALNHYVHRSALAAAISALPAPRTAAPDPQRWLF